MKTESQRDDDARDYLLSDAAGERLYKKARSMAAELGESFVVFIGSLAVPKNVVGVYSDRVDAIEAARTEAGYHRGFKSAPKVHLKRIKV